MIILIGAPSAENRAGPPIVLLACDAVGVDSLWVPWVSCWSWWSWWWLWWRWRWWSWWRLLLWTICQVHASCMEQLPQEITVCRWLFCQTILICLQIFGHFIFTLLSLLVQFQYLFVNVTIERKGLDPYVPITLSKKRDLCICCVSEYSCILQFYSIPAKICFLRLLICWRLMPYPVLQIWLPRTHIFATDCCFYP